MQFLEFPQHIEDDNNDDLAEGNVEQSPRTPTYLNENIDHVPVRGAAMIPKVIVAITGLSSRSRRKAAQHIKATMIIEICAKDDGENQSSSTITKDDWER
nr:hypothetical protein Iba_chr03cCG5700 [Ipomoea batatas]